MRKRWGPILILLAALAAILVVLYLANGNTHYDTSGPGFGLLVTMSFCAAGLFAANRYPDNRVGALLVGTSFAFVAGSLELTDVSLLFSFGLLLDLAWIGLLIHTLAVFPTGHFDSIWPRLFAATGWLVTVVIQFPKTLVNDPAVSDECVGCPENLFALIPDDSAFDTLAFIQGPLLGPAVITFGIISFVTKWRTATVVTRKALLPPLAVGTAAFLLISVAVVAEDVNDSFSSVAEWAAAAVVVAIPISMAFGVLQTRMRHNRLGELAVRLSSKAMDSNELEQALAWSVDDPTLRVAYWAPQLGHYLDANGSRVDDTHDVDRSTYVIEHDEEKVAMLVYDPTLDQSRGLIKAVGATAGLALENERLRAELRGQLVALQESRARLVTAERSERQRLERNLHDGAQQRLLALGLSLQLVHRQLDGAAPDIHEILDEAQVELREAMRELRDLAHGLHPAVLTESGLQLAIEALSTRAPFKVQVDYEAPDSFGTAIDAAAYYVVAEGLTNATKYAAPSRCRVTAKQTGGQLVVSVVDDGVGGADSQGSGLTGLSDRVAAIGGRLTVHSPPGLGTSITAKLPCAS